MSAEQAASAAVLEFRAALLLGHSPRPAPSTAGSTAPHPATTPSCWSCAPGPNPPAAGRSTPARSSAPCSTASAPALLPYTLVDAWLLEATLAVAADERPAARRALQSALAVAEPLDALRPFSRPGPVSASCSPPARQFRTRGGLRAAGTRRGRRRNDPHTILSERELTVLGLLPSMLSLDEIATDLTVSVNTVKSHVRSIYTKLGVSSRRTAVLSAHENGLLTGVHPS